jgi:hypothetical protein
MGDKFASALWLVGRFVYDARRPDFLDVTHPDEILKAARVEIDEEIGAMLKGHPGHRVTSLCVGAIAIREMAPAAKEWIASTAPLRAPCCTRQYLKAHDFVGNHLVPIRRLARSLAGSRKMTAAQALWIADQPRQAAA